MKKGQISNKMLVRFPIITKFVKKNKRLPTNFEIRKMFNTPVGQTTHNIINRYLDSLSNCVLCGKELKK